MSFEDKKKALFACLESAERSIAADSVLHQEDNVDYSRDRSGRDRGDDRRSNRRLEHGGRGSSSSSHSSIRKFRGKESIFKRPAAPIGKCLPSSRVPDYKKNPQNWTKYSLEDVDTSDRTNTAAAFSFLREIETQKRDKHSSDDDEEHSSSTTQFRGKLKFNRSIKLKSKLEEEDEPPPTEELKPKVKGSKVLMPEYVIGQKVKKSKPARSVGSASASSSSSKRDRSKELKLDHLMEDEDEEEDDEDGMD